MLKHIILDIILFLSIIICPWWVSTFFALFLLYYLRFFNEIILFGVVMDIFYGNFSPLLTDGFHLFSYKFTIFFLILLLFSFFVKKRLKFYSQ